MTETAPLKVHITGVYGLIGNLVYRHLSQQPDRYDVYGSGRRSMSSARADAESIARLPDDHFVDRRSERRRRHGRSHRRHGRRHSHRRRARSRLVVRRRAVSSNIVGTHNVLEGCRKAGVTTAGLRQFDHGQLGLLPVPGTLSVHLGRSASTTYRPRSPRSPIWIRPARPNPTRPARSGPNPSAASTSMPMTYRPSVCASAM